MYAPGATKRSARKGEPVAAFADQYHLEHVRQRLWSNREDGRAVVLIGAGFSRDAEDLIPGATFPDWRQ